MQAPNSPSNSSSTLITMPTYNLPTMTGNTASTPATNIYRRKTWTAAEIDWLCCLRVHTNLSYAEIGNLIQQQFGGALVKPDVVRYKINVLSCHLPPTQKSRRVRSLVVDPRWSHFSSLSPSSLEVQRILRPCGITNIWAGQLLDDCLCVLMMHGDVLNGEVARRVNERFGCNLEAGDVAEWYEAVEGKAEGSWEWFNGKGEDDVEVRAILAKFGL